MRLLSPLPKEKSEPRPDRRRADCETISEAEAAVETEVKSEVRATSKVVWKESIRIKQGEIVVSVKDAWTHTVLLEVPAEENSVSDRVPKVYRDV